MAGLLDLLLGALGGRRDPYAGYPPPPYGDPPPPMAPMGAPQGQLAQNYLQQIGPTRPLPPDFDINAFYGNAGAGPRPQLPAPGVAPLSAGAAPGSLSDIERTPYNAAPTGGGILSIPPKPAAASGGGGLLSALFGLGGDSGLYGDAITPEQKAAVADRVRRAWLAPTPGPSYSTNPKDILSPIDAFNQAFNPERAFAAEDTAGKSALAAASQGLENRKLGLTEREVNIKERTEQRKNDMIQGLLDFIQTGDVSKISGTGLLGTPMTGAPMTGGAPASGAGGGNPDTNLAATLVSRHESGNDPYKGYGGTDLSKAPLDQYGFPQWAGAIPKGGTEADRSHAAGLYQFQPDTWRRYAEPLGIKDFSPESQRRVFEAAYAAEGFRPWAPYNPNLRADLQRRGMLGGGSGGSTPPQPAPLLASRGAGTDAPFVSPTAPRAGDSRAELERKDRLRQQDPYLGLGVTGMEMPKALRDAGYTDQGPGTPLVPPSRISVPPAAYGGSPASTGSGLSTAPAPQPPPLMAPPVAALGGAPMGQPPAGVPAVPQVRAPTSVPPPPGGANGGVLDPATRQAMAVHMLGGLAGVPGMGGLVTGSPGYQGMVTGSQEAQKWPYTAGKEILTGQISDQNEAAKQRRDLEGRVSTRRIEIAPGVSVDATGTDAQWADYYAQRARGINAPPPGTGAPMAPGAPAPPLQIPNGADGGARPQPQMAPPLLEPGGLARGYRPQTAPQPPPLPMAPPVAPLGGAPQPPTPAPARLPPGTPGGPGSPFTTVPVDTEFDKALGPQMAKNFTERRDAAEKASEALNSTLQAMQLVDSGIYTGRGADLKTQLAKMWGMASGNPDMDVARTEAFIAQRAKNVMSMIGALGSASAVSNLDLQFTREAAAGTKTLDEATIREILRLELEYGTRLLDRYNKDARQVDARNKLPYSVTVPEPAWLTNPDGTRNKDAIPNSFLERKPLTAPAAGTVAAGQSVTGPGVNGAPPATAPVPPPLPRAGEVRDGYRYVGGNPADAASWQKVP